MSEINEIPDTTEETLIISDNSDIEKQIYTGQVKWFNDRLGYGFVTICDDSDMKGKDIFIHHTDIKPRNSNYKTLTRGEYINFNIINGKTDLQAVNITGINNGPLFCDFNTTRYNSINNKPIIKQWNSQIRWSNKNYKADFPNMNYHRSYVSKLKA